MVTKESGQDLPSHSCSSFTVNLPKVPPKSNKIIFLNLIKRLGLQDKYPQKLQLIDALVIHPELLNTNDIPNDIHVFPYLILQKIMMYSNYRPLCKSMSEINPQFKVHPIDILLTLLHCCDNILRQDLLSRLHTCKLAVPFLLPDPNNNTVTLLLWAMRSIICEWKCKIGRNISSVESRIVYHKGPIISFLRVGSTKSAKDFSKSHILNTVIGEQKYFFHWNCPGGKFSRQFVDGLVELSYYLPSGKETDSFSDAVTFINLRGEARKCNMQLNFIKKISFMSFLVLIEENLNDSILNLMQELAGLPGGLVIIFPDYEYMCTLENSSTLLKTMSEKNITQFNIKDENEDEIKSHIQKLISEKISVATPSNFLAISECGNIAQKIGIMVDEDDVNCNKGCALATDMLGSVPKTYTKTDMLPLQGPELWQKWAKYDKESFQKRNEKDVTVAYFNQKLEEKKKEIRKKQFDFGCKLTPLMKKFTDVLQNHDSTVRNYTLQWLKIFLDDKSRNKLPKIHTKYEDIRKDILRVKNESSSETSASVGNLISDLKKQKKILVEWSMGLENLFREVGQLYEAVKHHNNLHHAVDHFPIIMVEILKQGYPVEIMDGNASHVPMTWVSAILDQLKYCHKGKVLFVISVLGIQSTGKSTLLNTIFGLQFNVSAGRCTKGAFIQLLPVQTISDQCVKKSMCDYVLIVDTEGLRAPELNSEELVSHDNELATFVIGLADVAIINIYGEAPGDLDDILQTVVHAFIRMRNVSLNLNCHFVYQNATALLVANKTKFGQEAFQDKLNEMTNLAAKAEHCEEEYSSFKDVIKFDVITNITYFPGLWKGDPPMAPVNPGYSDKALLLKSVLMEFAHDSAKDDPTFNNFQLLVRTLWNAVCSENYIFSFKNTLEVLAYNDLDAAFSQWSWILHQKMLEWQLQTGNAISSCGCSDISAKAKECLNNACTVLEETYIILHKQMMDLFENSEYSGTLAQWKGRYTIRLLNLKQDCKTEAKRQCNLLKLKREGHLNFEKIKGLCRRKLLQQIQELVAIAKQKATTLSQTELVDMFNENWKEWIKEFYIQEYQSMYASDDDIEFQITAVLEELLAKHHSILQPKLNFKILSKKRKHSLCIEINPKLHLTNSGFINKVTGFFNINKRNLKNAQKISDEIFVTAKKEFYEIKKQFNNFDKSYAFDLLKKFIDNIESHNKKNGYMLTSEYTVDMALAFASYMAAKFTDLMNAVRTTNDPILSTERLKESYQNKFLGQYRDDITDEAAAKSLCLLLTAATEAALTQLLSKEMADYIKHCDNSFADKKNFKVRLLKDLAAKNDFKLFENYLGDIRSSFYSWAMQYVEEFCVLHKNNITIKVRTLVHNIILKINTAVTDLDKNTPIKKWLQKLHERLSETLTTDLSEMQDLIGSIRVSSEHFVNTLSELLTQQEENIFKKITDPNSKDFSCITKWNNPPHVTLCDSVIGCDECCPFCKEQCELTDPKHVEFGVKHFINIHRPECLARYVWNTSKKLVFDLCTYSVTSKNRFKNSDTKDEWVPYEKFNDIYKDWRISDESPKEAPKYWQWFISHYLEDITEWVGAAPTSIDHLQWRAVSQEMAVASLSTVYKVN